MPVNTEHPEYKLYSGDWETCRDTIAGSRMVKSKKTRYLPRPEGQSESRYGWYLKRSMYFNAMSPTVAALSGFLFLKPVQLTPESEIPFFDGLTPGDSFSEFLKMLALELIGVSRVGVLVDADANGEIRFSSYRTEDIINWRVEGDYSRRRLTLLVLRERVTEIDPDDFFEAESVEQYRVLRLRGGVYEQEIYRKSQDKTSEEFVLTEAVTPRRNGSPLTEIPFVIMNAQRSGFSVEKPILLDLADVNIAHYRNSADREQGLYHVGVPTPWVAGFDPDQTKLRIGAGIAWVSENEKARAGFLEFTGQGLGALETAMRDKKSDMAVLGAKALEPQKAGVEASETHKLRSIEKHSALSGIAFNLDRGAEALLRIGWEWSGRGTPPDDLAVAINRDYTVTEANPQLVATLFGALQGGAISPETWWYNLQNFELTPPGQTFERESELIDARVPNMEGV